MNKLKILSLVALLAMYACGNKKDVEVVDDETISVSEINSENTSDVDITEIENKLKSLEPISLENFKQFFPEQVDGFNLEDIAAMKMEGTSTLTGLYVKENQKITFMIYDGAGAGSNMVATNIVNNLNDVVELETKTSRIKGINFRNSNALTTENFSEFDNSSSINFVENSRFYFQCIATNVEIETLKNFVEKLNFSVLK